MPNLTLPGPVQFIAPVTPARNPDLAQAVRACNIDRQRKVIAMREQILDERLDQDIAKAKGDCIGLTVWIITLAVVCLLLGARP